MQNNYDPFDATFFFIVSLIFLFSIICIMALHTFKKKEAGKVRVKKEAEEKVTEEDLEKAHKITVKHISMRCKVLSEINSHYAFNELEAEYGFTKYVNSKAKFDHFDTFDYFLNLVSEDSLWFETILKYAAENRVLFEQYLSEVRSIPQTPDNIIANSHMPHSKFLEIENDYFNRSLLHPITNFKISIKVVYSSSKRKRHYSTNAVFNEADIGHALKKSKQRYQKKTTASTQRSLMTPKLRYKILQRDGFRCCICGASSRDGAKLEVDHIIPVSKGGRTVDSNLRTLCQACNRGKSDEYDPFGIN